MEGAGLFIPVLWILAALCSVGIALLYYRGKKVDFSSPVAYWGALCIRAVGLFLLLVLLLDPLIRSEERVTLKPTLGLAIDASSSVSQLSDNKLSDQITSLLEDVQESFGERFSIDVLLFGDEVRTFSTDSDLQFTEERTNFNALFQHLSATYAGSNYAGTILISDGLYNEGVNPLYADRGAGSFLHTIVVGDTFVKQDASIRYLRCNDIAFIGNQFPVEVGISLAEWNGEPFQVKIIQNGTTVKEERIEPSMSDDFKALRFLLTAEEAGSQAIEVVVETEAEDALKANNSAIHYLDVLDTESEILILAAAPHPDIRFIRQTLERQKEYSVTTALVRDFDASLDNFDLVVTHNLPSEKGIFQKVIESGLPFMAFFGPSSNFKELNKSTTEVQVLSLDKTLNSVQGIYQPGFSLFQLEEFNVESVNKLPPVDAPFGEVGLRAQHQVLLNQRVGEIDSGVPLLVYKNATPKRAFFFAEGIWKWKMYGAQSQLNGLAEELLQKSIQFLIVKKNRQRLRVKTAPDYWQDEAIELRAELYNQSYDLTTAGSVELELANTNGEVFNYTFKKGEDHFYLPLGRLEPGKYTYTASATQAGEELADSGEFLIKQLSIEALASKSNVKLMRQLAQRNGGLSVPIGNWKRLKEHLFTQDELRAREFNSVSYSSIIEWEALLALALVLLAVEWLLRKRFGTY